MYMLGLPQPVVVKQPSSVAYCWKETGHGINRHNEMVHINHHFSITVVESIRNRTTMNSTHGNFKVQLLSRSSGTEALLASPSSAY
jgi:hypothetical protein